jgi:SPP1 family predicted phage head-tail adaptor
MIWAGQLTETLEIYAVTEVQSESGFKQTTETLRFRCKAYRARNKETYVVNAEELFHETELTFQVRYRKEIQETDIVVYNNQRYRITSLCPYKQENQITLILAKINE